VAGASARGMGWVDASGVAGSAADFSQSRPAWLKVAGRQRIKSRLVLAPVEVDTSGSVRTEAPECQSEGLPRGPPPARTWFRLGVKTPMANRRAETPPAAIRVNTLARSGLQ
jgi:hypothetical protein